jgi:hypothetical protein
MCQYGEQSPGGRDALDRAGSWVPRPRIHVCYHAICEEYYIDMNFRVVLYCLPGRYMPRELLKG